MLDLVASLVVDLSDQKLTVYNSNHDVVRVIPVSTGKASTPTPIFETKVFTKYRSVTVRGRTSTVPGVPYTMCVSANEAICMHAAPFVSSVAVSIFKHRASATTLFKRKVFLTMSTELLT